jgi:hypothetical protein
MMGNRNGNKTEQSCFKFFSLKLVFCSPFKAPSLQLLVANDSNYYNELSSLSYPAYYLGPMISTNDTAY